MISHKYKCIFIHLPKCAGTSMEKALGHFENLGPGVQDHRSIRMIEKPFITPGALSSQENIIEVLRRLKHQYIRNVRNPRNKLTVTKDQYKSYFKFTFIRNPWSRAFSFYKTVFRNEFTRRRHGIGINGHISLNEYLVKFAGKGLLKPQLYWLKDFKGTIPLDYIGRFEKLTEDFQEVCGHLQANHITLPHLNTGSGDDYREYYDEDSKKIISDIYQEEIKIFDYSF